MTQRQNENDITSQFRVAGMRLAASKQQPMQQSDENENEIVHYLAKATSSTAGDTPTPVHQMEHSSAPNWSLNVSDTESSTADEQLPTKLKSFDEDNFHFFDE